MFKTRSQQLELLDQDNIPAADLYLNLKELDIINRYLSGHVVTISGLKTLITDKTKEHHIVDIGSGGGDTLKAIAKWARKNGYKVKLTGVDLKPEAIDYARHFCKDYTEISFIESDYRITENYPQSIDIAITSLFCHHLTNEQNTELWQWMGKHAGIGFLINDLHRNPFAYYSIKWITALFSNSYLVKNDAALSVLRGFSKNELVSLSAKAGLKTIEIKWKWAFRWLIIYKNV
jgi:2-polyprenyl-3-methyl-5-hydroxy-6-metoxy-1,4-benzoquinol methylase